MLRNVRMYELVTVGIASFLMIFLFSGLAIAADNARIDPGTKVSVYRIDKKVDELKAEAPLPYDSLLECTDRCRVRMNSLYFVSSDRSSFSVSAPPQDNLIRFLQGDFYFSLTALPRQLLIQTPIEDLTVQQVIFQAAASGGRLDGYLFVKGDTTEIGVLEGGSLVVSSSHGEHVVQPGSRITIAQAGAHPEISEGAEVSQGGASTTTIVVGGVVGAAAIAGAVVLIADDDDDDDPSPASPSSP